MSKFKKHFRIYYKSNHPAYIVGEEKNTIIFIGLLPLLNLGIIQIGR